MQFRLSKRTVGVGVAAALMLGGGAVATAYAADDATVVTADATVGTRYLVKQGECRGSFGVSNTEEIGPLGGRTGRWVSRASYRPNETAAGCGGNVLGVVISDGGKQFEVNSGDQGQFVEVPSWEPNGTRGPDQPVARAEIVLCDAGHTPSLDDDGELGTFNAEACTRYLFLFN